ncbi:MAG: efflux RND transporter periplasmic adaptor subunit, partial [Nitrospinae bacterium]|nr:efflux RND transporter periplasmic adaptor subunit [Nitrospinota bacterium]
REFKTSQELYKVQAESLLNLKAKEDRLKKAEADLSQAERELNEAKGLFEKREKTRINLTMLKTEYERATKQKALVEAELELAISQLERLKSPSSLNGTVVSKEVKDGMAVSAGAPLMTIADIERLQVRADVDEVDAGRIKKGQEAVIAFESFLDMKFYGHVYRIAPRAVIKGERTVVEVIILIADKTDLLKIANQVNLKVIIEKKGNTLSLPLSALHQGSQPFVWLYQNGIARKTEVKTGLSDLESVEVISGLKEGDEVIVGGLDLKDGERVEVRK